MDHYQPMVDSLKYMSKLSLDVASYLFVHRLGGSGRARLKGDGVNLSHWLTSLASFIGSFFHKYPETELDGLLHYLVGRLREKRRFHTSTPSRRRRDSLSTYARACWCVSRARSRRIAVRLKRDSSTWQVAPRGGVLARAIITDAVIRAEGAGGRA